LAALSATLLHYLKDEARTEIPIWRMISMSTETLRQRAQNWVNTLGIGEVIEGQSTVGGGSLPDETLPTFVLALSARSPNSILAQLRINQPPVIARLEADKVIFDPRTIMPEQENDLISSIRYIFGK
jgi:L-seryl-tRNA(Ser) seleniumtransferase